jgi:hypothetical protein
MGPTCPVDPRLIRSGGQIRRPDHGIDRRNEGVGTYGPAVRIFRATVRGQFDGLDEDRQAALRAEADEHDLLTASFTREGTFVYSPALTWFNLRYELRTPDEASDAEAAVEVLAQATDRLERLAVGHKHLRVELLDMASMWRD